jgi:hypothetical protein
VGGRVECRREKELNDFQKNPLDIEILSNLRFGSLEIRDTSVTRVTNNVSALGCREVGFDCDTWRKRGKCRREKK